jgi:hypothetical protein
VAYTVTELLASIKRRSGMPTAQATYSTADLLAIANEQMLEYVVPLVLGVREDYWTRNDDQALTDGQLAYRIPYRALMGKLREVSILDAESNVHNLPRLRLSDLEACTYGFWLEGDRVWLAGDSLKVTDLGVTLRLTFHLRPNQMIETSGATTVASFSATNRTITLTSPPAAYTGKTSWDIIRGKTPFETLAYDAAGTLSGSTITFSASLPVDLAAGDYVCLTEQTPVPQIPVELHGLLAQKCALYILESKQMADKAAIAAKELGRLENDARTVLTPRVDGEALRIFNRNSLYRTRW